MSSLPAGARMIADDYPEAWAAWSSPRAATSEVGPPSARERRLTKLSMALGAASE